MTFNELELNKDVTEMGEEEAKETLSEFMEAHQKNQSEYDSLQVDLQETKTEYEEKIDDYEERISEFKEERAEEAAQYVKMPAGLLADRFSFSELEQIIEEGEEFSDVDDEAEEDDEPLTDFNNKEEKGRAESRDPPEQFRERAESKLAEYGIGGN